MPPLQPPNTIEMLVRRENRDLSTSDLVDWSVAAIEAGFNTPSICILASLHRDEPVADALPYLSHALAELNTEIPDRETLLRQYAAIIARQLLSGELDIETGLATMHNQVVGPLEHPEDLVSWCYLWDGLDPNDFSLDSRKGAPQEFDELVRTEALQLIANSKDGL